MKKCSRIMCVKKTSNKSVCDDCMKSDEKAIKNNKVVLDRLFNKLSRYK